MTHFAHTLKAFVDRARSRIWVAVAPTRCKVTLSKPGATYQDFLTLWKDADPDPDIPILKESKAECAKLQ